MTMNNNKGFILLLTFILMAGLVLMIAGLVYLVSYETRDLSIQMENTKLLNIAEAGVQRAKREIRDDKLTTTQQGVADLRGATATGTASGNPAVLNRVRYVADGGFGILTMDATNTSTNVVLSNFDLNYLNTRVASVKIGCRYKKTDSGGPTDPNLQIAYKTAGAIFPEPGSSSINITVDSIGFNAAPCIVLDITADRTWTWNLINNSNFQIRAQASGGPGTKDVDVDYLFLQVTYGIDTLTEPWSTGSYATFPIDLGAGTIESVTIAEEQGKVHLNAASEILLRDLMIELGLPSGQATTLADNIDNYRVVNPFDSVEELQQVTGIDLVIYSTLTNFVTVYSYINTYATGPVGNRAPININTASREVLEAIFDSLTFDNANDVPALANAIITQRNTVALGGPFTCFYSSNPAILTDFYDFERSQSYLSDAEDDRVLGNADASLLVPRQGGNNEPALTTEFSYDSYAFTINSLANIGGTVDAGGRNYRIRTILGDDGSQAFTTYSGDTTTSGWRKENFESPPPP